MGSGGGRAPCCAKVGLNKGSWTLEEDMKLIAFIQKNGHVNWRALPKLAGLLRCGKSCRLRWINYLRPGIKRGNFTKEEEDSIIKLHGLLGNKWSKIASYLPGRTDNEIKNVWHTHLKKRSNSNSKPVNKDNNLEEALLTSSSSSSSFSSRSRSSSSSSSTSQYSCSDHGDTKSDEEHNNPSLINITETRDIEEQDKSVAAEEHLGQYSLTTTSTEMSDGVNDEEAGAAANGEYGCLVVLPHDIQIDPDHIWSMIEEEDEHWTSGTVESDREGEWLGCLEEELGLRELATVMEVEEEDNHLLHPPPWLQMQEDPVPSCYFSNGVQFSPPPSPLIISFESSTCLELRS